MSRIGCTRTPGFARFGLAGPRSAAQRCAGTARSGLAGPRSAAQRCAGTTILTLLAIAACGGSPPPAPPPPPRVAPAPVEPPRLAPPSAPGLRLDADLAAPTRYDIELTIDPARETFDGVARISLDIREDLGGLWLHGVDLTIGTAVVNQAGRRVPASVIPATPGTTDSEVIGFAFDGIVHRGPAELIITYRGKVSSKELDGIHRQEERGEWYVFTQFEATDARRAFPCFDEPSFKVPFGLTLTVDKAHVAVSNAPVRAETEAAGGKKVVAFADTRPLPTYLIALAVGPFDIVDGGKGGKHQTPLRIIVPKGRGGEAAYATKTTPELLALLEDYFGIPYPYEKLDQIAVPRKGGAMENPGLITYGLGLLIWPPEDETLGRKKRFAGVGAHELAHMWFGNLVTLAWWDDTWLNESFASWMADITEIKHEPTWGGDVFLASRRSGVMKGDTLKTTRKIRQPIESKHDIANAFDGITYGKGASVLVMVEAWMGAERFRQAVRTYLAAHAHKTATTADFLAALSAEGGAEVAPVMSSFLDQTGVPLIGVELQCPKDAAPKLVLDQQRYTTIGQPAAEQTWHVPVCVEFGGATSEGRACTVLSKPTGELELPTRTCPAWVLANDGELGYYRVAYRGKLLDKLLAIAPKLLTLPERIGIYGDLSALVDADQLPIRKVLELAPVLAKEDNRHLLSMASSFAGYLSSELVPKKLRPNRARFVRKLFGARARKLGWSSPKGEPDDVRAMRSSMLAWVAHTGEDPRLIAEARQLANKWLADRKSLDPDVVDLVLGIAARFGDRALFDKLHAAAKVEKERKDRRILLGAMGDFRDPAIVKRAMEIALTDEFPSYESIGLVRSALNEDTRELAYQFIKRNHDALIAKLPRDYSFHGVAGAFCDAEHRADAEAFFKDKVAKIPGGPRSFAATLERIDLCIARKQAHGPGIAAFLARY